MDVNTKRSTHLVTSACDACKRRKRKCECVGTAPCSYCVANEKTCTFSQKRKRGPKTQKEGKETTDDAGRISLASARHEGEVLDRIEARNYFSFYSRFLCVIMPKIPSNILKPSTNITYKVQVYSALAYASRVYGDIDKSKIYLNQARILAASIFDDPGQDTVAAMLMMSNYLQLVLDIPLANYYSNIAHSLARFTTVLIGDKMHALCESAKIFSSETLTHKEQALKLKQVAQKIHDSPKEIGIHCANHLEVAAFFLDTFSFNIISPDLNNLTQIFELLDHTTISEKDRSRLEETFSAAGLAVLTATRCNDQEQILFLYSIYLPLFQAIIDWRSGHLTKAMNSAMTVLSGMKTLKGSSFFGILAEHPLIALMGGLVKFFLEQGKANLALEMSEYINIVCKIMSPEFDFFMKMIDDFCKLNITGSEVFARPPW